MKLILGFSVPLLFGYLFQQLYNLVDTMIVGQFLGVDALAAVGATGSINFLIIGFCNGVCSGFALPVAHRFGAKDYKTLRKLYANSIWLSVIFAVVMTALTVIFCRPILTLMRTPANIFEYSYQYILIIFIGIPATYLFNLTSGMIRALGNSRAPLIILVISSFLNVILDLVFILNFNMGVAGAAAAMFTTKTDIPNVNEDHIIGWVGGMDIPVLHDFYTGYEQGAKYIDPDIKILQAFAGSWTDPLKGKELTLAQYEQGADIVMNVASGTGVGILEGAKEADKYAIGVDLNQDSDQPGHILTSMVKRVDNACYLVIQSAVDGTFEGGTTKYLALKDGGVSLTDFSVIKESLGDKFPQDIVDKCDELAEKIKSGEIVVENYEGFGPEA